MPIQWEKRERELRPAYTERERAMAPVMPELQEPVADGGGGQRMSRLEEGVLIVAYVVGWVVLVVMACQK